MGIMEHKEVCIDNVNVSVCKYFLDDDNIPIIGHLKNFCFYNHDRCELFNCEFKRKAKDYKLKVLQSKLERIKETAEEAPAIDTELSLRILEIINDKI